MRGVVLSGGQSSRMGSDKGLLKKVDQAWVQIAATKLALPGIDVIISVNKGQLGSYSSMFPAEKLIVDDETISVRGPLLGLLSVHQQFPKEDLLVLACDMVEVSELILRRLVDIANSRQYDAYVYKTSESSQPLCAVYTSIGLGKVLERYYRNDLKKFSMMHVLDCINVKYIPVEASFDSLFNNYNSPEQLMNM